MWTPPSRETAASLPVHPRPPIEDTPSHVSEKILTSQSALEGELKHVTGVFADLKRTIELIANRSV
jgi:hypothetical protein